MLLRLAALHVTSKRSRGDHAPRDARASLPVRPEAIAHRTSRYANRHPGTAIRPRCAGPFMCGTRPIFVY